MSEWDEGYKAAGKDIPFAACPYNFGNAHVDQETFEREMRPKLNAWFDGWKARLKERRLGFNFKPPRVNHYEADHRLAEQIEKDKDG